MYVIIIKRMTFSQYFHIGYFVGNKFTMLCFCAGFSLCIVLASAVGSNKFMTATVAFQLNWPDKEKKISLSGLDLYSVSSFSS